MVLLFVEKGKVLKKENGKTVQISDGNTCDSNREPESRVWAI